MNKWLSKRLEAVLANVPQGARLADIGSDHAHIPIELVRRGIIDFAVAGEVIKGPFEIAKRNISQAGLTNHVFPRLADGLDALETADSIDTLILAGMGGLLITEILERGRKKLAAINTLILQPNNEETKLRKWLLAANFRIEKEEILEDKGKIYEILVAKHGSQALSEQEFIFGCHQRQHPIFQKKWRKRLAEIEKVLTLLPASQNQDREALLKEKSQIEEVLHENP